jgi:glycerophosphoryl diester phosphodiesterase
LNKKTELADLCTENNFISVFFISYDSFDANMVRMIHDSHKKIYIYTLNSSRTIPRKLYSTVDGIITDNPEMWLNLREK